MAEVRKDEQPPLEQPQVFSIAMEVQQLQAAIDTKILLIYLKSLLSKINKKNPMIINYKRQLSKILIIKSLQLLQVN